MNLREANTLLRKLFTSRKSEKNVRQHSGTQKGAIEAITSIHTGYMIRAPTFRRSTQRQEPHPLQLNTAAPQNLRSAGTAAFARGRFFCAAATKRDAFCPLAGQPQTRQKRYIYAFSIASRRFAALVVALGPGLDLGRKIFCTSTAMTTGRKEPGHEAAYGGRRRCPYRHDPCTAAFRLVRLRSAGKGLCRAYLTRLTNG